MTLLKWFIKYSLQQYKLNDPAFCDKLATNGVHTTNDLLFKTDASTLANQTNVAYEDLIKVHSCIVEKYSKKPITLKEAVERQRSTQSTTKSGCNAIDQLLIGGGIQSGQIVQISGADSTGKTQLCFNFILEAIKLRRNVLYLDTQNAFSATRLCDLVTNQSVKPDLVSLVDVVPVFSIQDLYDSLNLVLSDDKYSLLIIDSLPGLLDPLFAKEGPKHHFFNQAIEIARILNGIRHVNPRINIVVVNYWSRRFQRFFDHIYSLKIELSSLTFTSQFEERQIFQAVIDYRTKFIEKSFLPKCHFTITDSGVKDGLDPISLEDGVLSQVPASQALSEDEDVQLEDEQVDTGQLELQQPQPQEIGDDTSLFTESEVISSQTSFSLSNYLSQSPLSTEMDLDEMADEALRVDETLTADQVLREAETISAEEAIRAEEQSMLMMF